MMIPLWLIPLFPLLGVLVLTAIALTSSPNEKGADEGLVGFLGVLFPSLAFIATVMLSVNMPVGGYRETIGTWFDIQVFHADFGLLFDGLSRIMLLFVTGIGSLIVLYSMGYMHGDRGFARFFAYMNLFLFSMIVLVLSDNLPLTFLGWEGVGLCSYLLIGFWNADTKNCKAANKAFLVNRVGDVGFLLGMLALVSVGGSSLLAYPELAAWLVNPEMGEQLLAGMPLLTLAGFLLFLGCTGKSAQIPLVTWLPDAMAGPTPVSALIHAATMVTAGVYLVVRLSPLFAILPEVLMTITVIGLLTALWAAIAGLFQNDIKKVLAYSTISQLGYMFMAAGVAAFDASIFHVFTHAFFKAALFLGAGAVIHSLAGEQDMRKMGGMLRKTPVTATVMVFAFLAIIGFPFFAGFWSKDLILEHLFMFNHFWGPVFYTIALLTAVITAVYMTRLMVLTFFGSYRGSAESEKHIHEAPFCMLFPMIVLTLGSVFAGFLWAGLIPGADFFKNWLAPVVAVPQMTATQYIGVPSAHVSTWMFAALGTLAAILGILIGWKAFSGPVPQAKGDCAPTGGKADWTFAFDKLHAWCGILPTRFLAWVTDAVVNRLVMFLQWFVGAVAVIFSDGVRSFQVRKVRMQLGFSILGMLAVLVIAAIYGGSL